MPRRVVASDYYDPTEKAVTTSYQKAVGSAGERRVAGMLGGRRVGMDGGPVDVVVDGYLNIQVKTVAHLPSLNVCRKHIDAIAKGDHIRASVIVERPGSGRIGRKFIVMDLDEFADWHSGANDELPF
jgi:hypothetical protein